MARTRVARTRLAPDESAELDRQVKEAGVSESEYLRGLIVGPASVRALADRVESLEARITHVEQALAKRWLLEAPDDA